MSADETAWPRARWVRVIALLFAGQLFLTWVLAERVVRPVREAQYGAPVALLTLPSANLAVHQHPSVAGATLFALVDPRGFSGAAWLRAEARETPLTEWKEPDFWLAANPDRLGLPFQRFIQTNAPQLTSAAVVPVFERTPVVLPPVIQPTQSSFSVSGELASRKLLNPPAIPLWPLAGTLRATHVTIAVDASGDVFSAVQEVASNLLAEQKSVNPAQPLADKQALELVQHLRFAPSPTRKPNSPIGANLTWGTVIIHWRTTAPAITNSPLP
jgi:hypothetical protein